MLDEVAIPLDWEGAGAVSQHDEEGWSAPGLSGDLVAPLKQAVSMSPSAPPLLPLR